MTGPADGSGPNAAPDAPAFDVPVAELRRRRGTKWTHYGPDVLAAWVADMDFPPAPPVIETLAEALALGDFGYGTDEEIRALAEAFSARSAARTGWAPDPDRILVLADVMQGVVLAIEAFSQPGDPIGVQTPIYPPFLRAVASTGRRLVELPVVRGPEGRFGHDPAGFEALAASGARLALLCSPHNPTGRVWHQGELHVLAELAVERDLVVVADEIHADLAYPGVSHLPFAALGPEVEARTVTVTSASKAFNLAGLRCAVAAVGSADLLRRFSARPAATRGGVGVLGVRASLAAWSRGDQWLEDVVAHLDGQRRLLGDLLADRLPQVSWTRPEATYLAWLDCRALGLEDCWRSFLDGGVALSDGRHFGADGTGHVRLNFATSPAVLTEIVDRMANAVRRAGGRPRGAPI